MNDLFQKIENYLANNLSPKEHAAFEAQIKRDEQLAKEVREHQLANKTTELYKDTLLKEELMSRGRKILDPYRKVKQVAWAAAAIGLILIAVLLAMPEKESTSGPMASFNSIPEFLAQVKAPDLGSASLDSPTNAIDSTREALRELYRVKDCATYLENFEGVLTNTAFLEKYGNETKLYAGHCYFMTNDLDLSAQTLSAVPNTTNYYRPAQFYLAVTLLKQGQLKEASAIFSDVAEDSLNEKSNSAKAIYQIIDMTLEQ